MPEALRPPGADQVSRHHRGQVVRRRRQQPTVRLDAIDACNCVAEFMVAAPLVVAPSLVNRIAPGRPVRQRQEPASKAQPRECRVKATDVREARAPREDLEAEPVAQVDELYQPAGGTEPSVAPGLRQRTG